MSNPTIPPHRFVRPGQVDPSGVPDQCMTCGLPAYTHPTEEDDQLAALRELFPGWWIGPAPFKGWRAEWKSENALQIRYIGANSLADLHHKIEVIESARGEGE